MRKKVMWIGALCLSVSVGALCLNSPVALMSPTAIENRLTPAGSGAVTVGAPVIQRAAGPRTPQEIYDNHCVVCHGAGVAGAPKMNDKAAWSPRLKQGMATLLKHVKEGYKVMPAMGTCGDCTDKEFQDTIEFMSK